MQINYEKNWTSEKQLFPGVWVYKDVIKKEFNIINKIENLIKNSQNSLVWQPATVGYSKVIEGYRECFDIKLRENKNPKTPTEIIFSNAWKTLYDAQFPAVQDYCKRYNIHMEYWEAINFIKYKENQYFKEHSDHGFSYQATVSLVAYPNDDYEGGELYFPKIDLNIKPEAGDLYIFPSTYLFSHVAKPVISGNKYAIVTMLDYNDDAHSDEYMKMRIKKYNDKMGQNVEQ